MCPHCGGENGLNLNYEFVRCGDCSKVVPTDEWDELIEDGFGYWDE